MTQKFTFTLHVKGPDAAWDFPIPEGQTIIGRQVGVDLLLENSRISRKHAQFDCTAMECQLTDLGSSNGTHLNEEVLTPKVPATLKANDSIKIGPFVLSVEQVPVEVPKTEAQPPTQEIPGKPEPGDGLMGEEPFPLQPAEELPKAKTPPKRVRRAAAPPPPSKLPPPPQLPPDPGDENLVPPGLSIHGTRLLNFLPGIYHTDFMSRFLGIFETILTPIEWNIDNFDLYLSSGTAPVEFVNWLSSWFTITFDQTWSEDQRRELLSEAHQIYARRGTRWSLSRVLEIYTGLKPEILDQNDDLDPHTFSVKIPVSKRKSNPELIEAIIDANKPAHTSYKLQFGRR